MTKKRSQQSLFYFLPLYYLMSAQQLKKCVEALLRSAFSVVGCKDFWRFSQKSLHLAAR